MGCLTFGKKIWHCGDRRAECFAQKLLTRKFAPGPGRTAVDYDPDLFVAVSPVVVDELDVDEFDVDDWFPVVVNVTVWFVLFAPVVFVMFAVAFVTFAPVPLAVSFPTETLAPELRVYSEQAAFPCGPSTGPPPKISDPVVSRISLKIR